MANPNTVAKVFAREQAEKAAKIDPQTARSGRSNGRELPPNWKEKFVEALAVHGTYLKAAKRAGISTETVHRHRLVDLEFDKAVSEARLLAAEGYEEEIIEQARETGNPVGYIVRLKQLKPAEYIEKHAIHQVSVNIQANLDEAAAVELLKSMIADTSSDSRGYLAQPVPALMLEGSVAPAPAPTYEPDA